MRDFWDTKELALLLRNYADAGVSECAKMLGRSEHSVRNARARYKAEPTFRYFTAEEDAVLLEHGATRAAEMLPGRTRDALKCRLRLLRKKQRASAEVSALIERSQGGVVA